MVEVFVNGNTMGVVKAAADGTFAIKRIILEEGENTVAAFARSESQLQSPLSSPKTYILDLEPPKTTHVLPESQLRPDPSLSPSYQAPPKRRSS